MKNINNINRGEKANNLARVRVLFLFLFVIFAIMYSFRAINKEANKLVKEPYSPKALYHGPSPNIAIYEIAQNNKKINVLGLEMISPPRMLTVSNSIVEISGTPANAQEIPIIDSLTNTTSAPETRPEHVGTFGVAAGGGLPYFKQSDLDSYFASLLDLGITWVRWDIDWQVIQNDNANTYNWDGVDMVAATAKRYGINSLGIITYTPKWARLNLCKNDWQCEPADPKTFGHFAGVVAARYKDSISHFEIWNEPNYPFFWKPTPSVSSYAKILKEAYLEIKNANPDAIVLSGGLAPSADDAEGGISPITFLTGLYVLSSQSKYFDAVSFHPYTYPALPSYEAPWNAWQQMSVLHQIMISNNDANKKIWITEVGAPTSGPTTAFNANQLSSFVYGKNFMTETAQSEILSDGLDYFAENKDWLASYFFYSLRDNDIATSTPENFFGLLRHDGSKKPSYNVFQSFVSAN